MSSCTKVIRTFLWELLLFLFVILLQVDVGRFHSDNGLIQKTERFLHVFGLYLDS